MKITDAKWQDGWLMLKTYDTDARHFAYQFNQKKEPADYEIRRKADHRSLTANAYAWVLIDKLAVAMGQPKSEIYRNAIREVGGNCTKVCLQNEAVKTFCDSWRRQGLGWQTEEEISKLPNCTTVTVYYGSSVFDTKQMARLIDNLVQDCRSQDIETLPPEQLARLLDEWGTNEYKVK